MKKRIVFFFIFVTLFILLLSACSSPAPTSTSTTGQTDGKTLMETRCTVCHSTARITSKKDSFAGWDQTVTRMINQGAILTDAEKTVLVQYLADTYK